MELNHRFLFVGQESLPLDHGTVLKWTHWESHPDLQACGAGVFLLDHEPVEAEAVGLEPTSRSARPTVFKTVSSSGRMTSVCSCGSWNRTNIKTFRASRPTVRRSRNCCSSSGGRNRTYGLLIQSQASLPTATTPECSLHFKSALRELNPPRQLGRLAPLPLGQGHAQRKE